MVDTPPKSNVIDMSTGKRIEVIDPELEAIRLRCKKALPATARLLNELAEKFRRKFPNLSDVIHPSSHYHGRGKPKQHHHLSASDNHSPSAESWVENFQDWLAEIFKK